MKILYFRQYVYMVLQYPCSHGPMFWRLYVLRINVLKAQCSKGCIFSESMFAQCFKGCMFTGTDSQSYMFMSWLFALRVLCSRILCPQNLVFQDSIYSMPYFLRTLQFKGSVSTHFMFSDPVFQSHLFSGLHFPRFCILMALCFRAVCLQGCMFSSFVFLGPSVLEFCIFSEHNVHRAVFFWVPHPQHPSFCGSAFSVH